MTTTVRVSVREIREAAFRALLAAGTSGGEAAASAELVVHGEVFDGDGVRALLDELDRVPGGRVPVTRDGTDVDVLHDPADRGPLLLGPLAADLAAAGRRPVLLPGLAWSPVVEWILGDAAGRSETALLAIRLRANGLPGASALATPDGAVHRAEHTDSALDGPVRAAALDATRSYGEAILLRAWTAPAPPEGMAAVRTPAQRDEHRAGALRDGLRVDAARWASARAAARRFLVPEPCDPKDS